MNIKLFFDPISSELASEITSNNFSSISLNTENTIPKWKEAQVALITLNDTTDESFRKQFYKLNNFSNKGLIADLGSLRLGSDSESSILRLAEVLEALIQNNTIPIVLAKEATWSEAVKIAFKHLGTLLSTTRISATISEEKSLNGVVNENGLMYNTIKEATIAYQRPLNNPEKIKELKNENTDLYSIGEIRNNINETEPVLRGSKNIDFSLSAVKCFEIPGFVEKSPFGLTYEEACQLAWFSGLSDSLKSFVLYSFSDKDFQDTEKRMFISMLIWYLIEGVFQKETTKELDNNKRLKYSVSLSDKNLDLVFYKSRFSEKWWFDSLNEGKSNSLIPCSYQDYEEAVSGKITDRLFKALKSSDF